MEIGNIEKFFLNILLKVCIVGLFLILISDIWFYIQDTLSILITFILLVTVIIAYFIKEKYPTVSVLIVTVMALLAMTYQRLTIPNTTTTLAVVMILGFIFSVMFKGKLMWIMHGITFLIINTAFVYFLPDAISAAITYSIIYFILTYTAGILKSNYDKINQDLIKTNAELNDKASEIKAQNEELLQIQEQLNTLNVNLENIVNERTDKIKKQNEILVRYNHNNAHYLRAPVARLIGIATVYNLEPDPNTDFFVQKMLEQANEIDAVINKIKIDLEANDFD